MGSAHAGTSVTARHTLHVKLWCPGRSPRLRLKISPQSLRDRSRQALRVDDGARCYETGAVQRRMLGLVAFQRVEVSVTNAR